jgi:general L-amino acid transport system substrate-binding protein
MRATLGPWTAALALVLVAAPAQAQTLDEVRERGFVRCGVSQDVPGFSQNDSSTNQWTGFDVDYCRALASAIFNDAQAVRFTPVGAADRFAVLGSSEVDVLTHTTWTMTRDTAEGAVFAGTLFYDSQGFVVRTASGFTSALDLSGTSVCVETGSGAEQNLQDYFAANDMEFTPVVMTTREEALKAFEDSRCQVLTGDSADLAGSITEFAVPGDYALLPEVVAKEPVAIAVRQGDDAWFTLARWVYFALLEAEELGVTQVNVDQLLGTDNPAIRRLLGIEGDYGTPLGLNKDWAYQVIRGVGNYAEIFERNVGAGSPLQLERGLNALWNAGGLHYSPPIL